MTEKKSLDFSQLSGTLSTFYAKPVAKVSLELFLSFGLVIGLVIVAIQPTLTTIAQLNTEIAEKKELTETLENKISTLNSAITLYSRYRDKMHILNESLPSTAELIPTLKIIEKLATDSNVIITGISVDTVPEETTELQTTTSSNLTTLPVSISIMGQYQDMRNFVEALHNSRRTVNVLSISFSLEESRGDKALSANLLVDAPYYGTPK